MSDDSNKNNEEFEMEEIVPDQDSDSGSVKDSAEIVAKLKKQLKEVQAQKDEYLLGWQKARADFVNLRKKDEEDKKEFIKFANERLVEDLIPVLDSFDTAFSNKEAWEKIDKNWRIGVECIYSQLKSVLDSQGLKEVNPIGLYFDINRDEAVEYIKVDKEEDDNKVVSVIKRGYTLNGKLVRPTKVKVGEFK